MDVSRNGRGVRYQQEMWRDGLNADSFIGVGRREGSKKRVFTLDGFTFLSTRKHRVLRTFTIRGQGGEEGIKTDVIALASQYLKLKGNKKSCPTFLKALSIPPPCFFGFVLAENIKKNNFLMYELTLI